MSLYAIHIRVQANLYYGSLLGPASSLTEALSEVLADGVIGEARGALEGGEHIDLLMHRPTHQQAVTEILGALESVGFSLLEAEVDEIVDKAVQGAVLGFCGGGGLGLTTKNPYVELLAAAIGALAGSMAGSKLEEIAARFHYRWFPATGWVVTQLPIDSATGPTEWSLNPTASSAAR